MSSGLAQPLPAASLKINETPLMVRQVSRQAADILEQIWSQMNVGLLKLLQWGHI